VDGFCQVKVQTWVDGVEDAEFVGVGARFGTTIVSKEKNANQIRLTLSDPLDCCSAPKHKVFPSGHYLCSRYLHIAVYFSYMLWTFTEVDVLQFVSLIEMSSWFTEVIASSLPKQIMLRLLVLQPCSL
jgi:hypothetical protein